MLAEGGSWLMDLAPGTVSSLVWLQTNWTQLNESNFPQAQFSDHGTWLAIADGEALRVSNLNHQRQSTGSVLAAGDFLRQRLRFSRDEQFLGAVTGRSVWDEAVVVWEVASKRELARFYPHRDHVTDLDFSPDGGSLATVSYDNTCKVLDLLRQKEMTTLHGHSLALFQVCFSPDGRRLVAGVSFGSIIMWDLETGHEVLVLEGP